MLVRGVELRVVEGDLLRVPLPGRGAVVNPANTLGHMAGGVAGAIRSAAGAEVEAEARKRAPIPLGGALLTGAGALPLAGVIHAPTMVHPGEAASAEVVREACRAAITLAHGEGLDSVAFPGMGTGVGGLEPRAAARAMVQGLREGLAASGAPPPARVVLVAWDALLREAFEAALQG